MTEDSCNSSFKSRHSNRGLLPAVIDFSLIIAAVLTGAFVFEITVEGVLRWDLFFKTASFYLLTAFAVCTYLYYRFIHTEDDSSVVRFMDDEYCKAYMRKECLPALTKTVNKLIKSGESTAGMMSTLRDLDL